MWNLRNNARCAPGMTCNTRCIGISGVSFSLTSDSEKSLGFRDDFDHAIDFRLCVVEIEAGACRRCDAEFFHQRLIAMMSAAERDAALVGEGDDVVGVNF